MVKKVSALVLATALISTLFTPLTALASGDNIGGRDTYSLQAVSEGALGDTVTFNSISITDSDYAWYKEITGEDLPSGTITEEANYVGARIVGENQGGAECLVWQHN